MTQIARLMIIFGVILVVLGGLIFGLAKGGMQIGRLPGDLRIQNGNFTCVIALGSSILLSLLLTILLNLLVRFLNK